MPQRIGARGIVHDPAGFVSGLLSRPLRTALAAVVLALAGIATAGPLAAQSAEVSREENFRSEPNGILLAVLAPGTELAVHGRRENWIEASMEGWVWARSLLTTERGDYDLIVSTGEGENLRDRPSGEILGRLEDGTFLEEIERIPGWIRVRRRGWIWSASVEVEAWAASPNAAVSPVPVTTSPPAAGGNAGAGSGAAARTPGSAARPPEVLRGGVSVLNAPGGDTLTVLRPGAEVVVMGREGNWARVRVEGWVWQPQSAPADAAPSGSGSGAASAGGGGSGPTFDQVRADPASARGRIVTWDLQFISLERAEAVRTDFFEGEPFLLMRPVGRTGTSFVYVAIPEDRLELANGLVDLETVTIVARIRTGAARLTGSPILDLIEIR